MNDKGTIVQQLEAERDYLLEKIRLLCSEKTDLKAQLQKTTEAMKAVRFVVAHTESHVHDNVIVHTARLIGGNQYAYLKIGHLRRLVETLEE